MSPLRRDLLQLALEASRAARRGVRAVERFLDRDPFHVVGYHGYATAERALVLGRALENERIAAADAGHSAWRNFRDVLKRIESDPLPHALVRANLAGSTRDLVADDEGFVREWLALAAPLAPGWHEATLSLVEKPRDGATGSAEARARILVPPPTPRFAVISDMDDTVLQSEVTNFLRAARLMLLNNSRTRLPFPGVAAFYRALHEGPDGGERNPIFYVSSSPWNLHDVITDFLSAQQIPEGPLLLRDWDLGQGLALARNAGHKRAQIDEILRSYPLTRFILVGDSGQEDPEIYSKVVHDFPGRIVAVYIRNVTPRPERVASIRELEAEVAAAGATLVLADDTLTIARHAAAHGWIAEAQLAGIGEEKRDDQGKTGAKVETPGVDVEARAPTVVVDDAVSAAEIDRKG